MCFSVSIITSFFGIKRNNSHGITSILKAFDFDKTDSYRIDFFYGYLVNFIGIVFINE